MKVFLTGGTGFIGQPLTQSLLRRGWSVTALVRKSDSPHAQALSKMGAQLASGDVTKRESMRTAMSGADIVVHNAGHYEMGLDSAGKQCMQAINVGGTKNVLELARELSIPRTIYVSTTQVFGETGDLQRDETFTRQVPCRTTYERTKTDAHEVARQLQQQGMPIIIVCPNGVIGANDHSPIGYYLRLYLNRLMPPLGWSPASLSCCVALNDLVEGIILTAEKGQIGDTYILCGEPQSLREIFECWSKKPGAVIPSLWLPIWLAAALFAPLEPLERAMGLPALLSRESVRFSATNWNFSNEKAKRELGWTLSSAEEMWSATIDGELKLLSKRKGQNLIQRLKPLEMVE
jgi:dihydroflavonol-4-reductase